MILHPFKVIEIGSFSRFGICPQYAAVCSALYLRLPSAFSQKQTHVRGEAERRFRINHPSI